MMNNITTLTKDLFHNPPSFKSAVTLSFKAPVTVVSHFMHFTVK